jgi:predicted nucleotidyltransferase
MPQSKFAATLRLLHENNVDFILVGGLAAVLHGSPIHTADVDLVYSVDAANIDRLLRVLEQIDAIFRAQPERRLLPNRSHLVGGGHLNLLTRHGPLDLLGTIGNNLDFRQLLPHSTEMEIGHGLLVKVLNLETIIEIKEQLGSEKDAAVLPTLRQTLSELKRKRGI